MGRNVCNFVHNDEIWKDYVRREMYSAARKWPDNWGFMTKIYDDMNRELDGCDETGKPAYTSTAQAQHKVFSRVAPEKPLKLPSIQDSKYTYPGTTAKLIGWKATQPEARLELYGKYSKARGKKSILKVFKWPPQGL